MSSSKETVRLQDIMDNIDAVTAYVGDMTVDATERCLQRITEAVIKIGEARMLEMAPDIPFHAVRALGNALRHAYDDLDLGRIFVTVKDHLPPLRAACDAAVRSGLK